ncbi:MAG: deoxyribose-phosphate aldolase [Bacteroidales bacterium]|nr:deoxyribose-phosphate aldolase [Bacteroidales bacterium]MBN2756761.1 deoxyribose-phosphate aldolase [Bacteroidales bacterium]
MKILENYKYPFSGNQIEQKIIEIKEKSKSNYTVENLKKAFSFIDLTSLNSTDKVSEIEAMCQKVNTFSKDNPDFTNVAAICVYPSMVETVKKTLTAKNIEIAAVSAGFPSAQTFIEIKKLESEIAIKKGADELDIVISIGELLSGNYQKVYDEIKIVKDAIGTHHLKVILESGALENPENIWKASILAMEAGADFIKTSTGKLQPAATLEAAIVMSEAIKAFNIKHNKKIGFKPAGGVSTGHQAIEYYTVMKETLGNDWLNSKLFRIGASSLANNILSEISSIESGIDVKIKYF